MNEFVSELILKLNGKLSDEDLKIVSLHADMLSNDYTITRKETLPATIGEVCKELQWYIVSRKIEGLSDNTLFQYQNCLNHMFRFVLKSPKDFTANDIRIYLYNLKEVRNLSDRTLDTRLSYIRAFFQWCVDNDYFEKNPCKQIKHIKYEKVEKYPFMPTEMERLRKSCRDDRDRAVIETLYSTGCRVSELVNIKLSDIDISNKSVYIIGKGKKGRTVYLNAKAEIAISEYLSSRGFESDWLFCSVKSPHDKIKASNIEKIIRILGRLSGVANCHPHRFRRTMATDALRHGMPIEEVRELLGHESLDTTDIYAKTTKDIVRLDHAKYVV